MKDPIEGEFTVLGDSDYLRPSERPPWKYVVKAVEVVVTWAVIIALMIPVWWLALMFSKTLFPTGPL